MKKKDFIKKTSKSLADFFNQSRDGVYYLSHATILVSLSGKKILCDPVLAKPPHMGSWLFYPEMKLDKCLLNVDIVFISHTHLDHYDVDFLKLLSPHTKIYIISGRPQFAEDLKKNKISFDEIKEDSLFDLGNGISCVGVTHEYNGIDSAIAISNGSFTVYHGNDCYVSNEKIKIIKKYYPNIHVACVPFAYIHWYPFLLDDVPAKWKKEEGDRLIKKYLDFGLDIILNLNPEVAIPFGANMFYYGDIDSAQNKAVLTPFDFVNYAQAKNFSLKQKIKPLFAGDVIYHSRDLNKKCEILMSEFSKEQLMEGLKNYINLINRIGTGFDYKKILAINDDSICDIAFISKRLEGSTCNEEHFIYISNSENPIMQLTSINLKTKEVQKTDQINLYKPYHWFKLTNLAYKAYFSKKYSFNDIINTCRFTLARNPNQYNLNVVKIFNNFL